MNIMLVSQVFVITKILKKTKTRLIKDLKIGERIMFSMPMKGLGRGRSGIYASHVTVTNLDTDDKTRFTLNEMDRIFTLIELEKIND